MSTALAWLALTACGDGPRAAPPTAPVAPPSSAVAPTVDARSESEPVYRRTRQLMSTMIEITVVGASEEKAGPAVEAAFREMQQLEGVLSEWIPESEISRINAGAGTGPVHVGPHALAVVRTGLDVSAWSEGAFDLSWAALHGLYRFRPGEERIATEAELREHLGLIDYRQIAFDESASTVALGKAGMKIGTGGIAKGYALDRAGAVLRAAGLENFMLFGGGQVQVSGRRKGRPWRIGIQHPRRDDYFAFLESTGGSVSTSGDYEHSFERDGKRWHHIIDTKTGLPVPHTASVTVLADSGIHADALSTAIFVLGAERALRMLPQAPGRPVGAVIVDADMKVHVSEALAPALRLHSELVDGRLPL